MRSFGKAMRNTLPAIGLGLLTATGLATVMAVTAPAAEAQRPVSAKKEFVEPYQAATEALAARKYQEAVANADKAYPHAADNQQKMAIEGVRIQAYHALKQHANLVRALEASLALGGLTADQVKSYKQLQAAAYADMGNTTRAVQLTKEFVNQYGGTPEQYAWLAQDSLRAKNYKDAVSYSQKAIDEARKTNRRPQEAWHKILLAAHYEAREFPAYFTALERVALEYQNETYWRALVTDRTSREPKFRRADIELDMFRTLAAAKVNMTTAEQLQFAELAFIRGSTVEAETILGPLITSGKAGGAGDPNADRIKRLYANIQTGAREDKNGGLAESEKAAATSPTGEAYIVTGEAYMGVGDYKKAAELIKKGIDKGQISDEAIALANLRLGMAQFHAGDKEEARRTWTAISADNGARALARSWILISRL